MVQQHKEIVMKVNELFETSLDEGAWDYVTGMAGHIGGKVKTAIGDKLKQAGNNIHQAHQAGQFASQQGDIKSLSAQQQQLIQQLVKLGGTDPISIFKLIDSTMGSKVNLASKMKKDFKQAIQSSQSQTNEGIFDYMRGAGGAAGGAVKNVGRSIGGAARQVGRSAQQVGQAVGGAVSNMHQQGQQASLQANIQKTIQQLGQVMLKLNALQKNTISQPPRTI